MPEPGEIIGSRYHIIEELGSGWFGKTYLAEDINLPDNPWCVVKQLQPRLLNTSLLPNAKERFDNEAIVLQRLGNHEQIPRLLANFEERGEFYLVQEFIDGEDLRKEIDRQLLSETEVIVFLQDVLKILDFVHQQGVIHRDIKPSNLIRRRRDRKIVLIDFGSVKEIGTMSFDSQGQQSYTQMVGTPVYMPPEQLDGRPVYSSDIYALGRTAIYALTGRSLIELEDTQTGELLNWQKLARVSQKLAVILDKMVRPKYVERYQCPQEVLCDLQPLLKIGKIVGKRYKINSYLGGGVWDYTYLAENSLRPYQSTCIVKQLKLQTADLSRLQKAERRFVSQLKVLERIGTHNQIPQLVDHFEENQEFYLVEEFIDGENLAKELQEGKRLSEETVITLLKDVLEILDFVHQQGVIHHDIKPSNLIRRRSDGKIVLIDFGVLKEIVNLLLDSKKSGSNTARNRKFVGLDKQGKQRKQGGRGRENRAYPSSIGSGSSIQTVGSEGYMPPEQMVGSPTLSSDIYALGMTAIQALTGICPDQLQMKLQRDEVIWRQEMQVSPRLAKILDKMVRLDVKKRYRTAVEVLKDLKTKKSAQPLPLLPQLKPWYRYSLLILAISGAVLFLLIL